MTSEDLRLLGLTDNEATLYLALLKRGRCGGTQLRNASGLANSRVYAALDALMAKGLVTYEKHPQGKLYSAVDPSVLRELAEERKARIERCIPILKQLQAQEKSSTDTAVYEGYLGFKTALQRMAADCPAGATVKIIGFSAQEYKNERLAAILRDVNKVSKRKRHRFQMLLDGKDNPFFRSRKQEGISEIRFMQKGFKSPAAIDIYGDTVYILLWDETPYAFVVKNARVAEGFRTYFDILWGMAKR